MLNPDTLLRQMMAMPEEQRAEIPKLAEEKRQQRSMNNMPQQPDNSGQTTVASMLAQDMPQRAPVAQGPAMGQRAMHQVRSQGGKMGAALQDILGFRG